MNLKAKKDTSKALKPDPDYTAKPLPGRGGINVQDTGIYNNPLAPIRGAKNEQKKKGGAGWIEKA